MLPATVVDSGPWCEMAVAVDFDCQSQCPTIEVDNKFVHAVLASELVPEHLSVGEMHPEEHFSCREMTSEVAASLLEGSDVEVEGHRCEEVNGKEKNENNLVSHESKNKKM